MKKVLITGATGFIGYHLAKKLLKRKYQIFSFSRHNPVPKKKLKNVKYFYGDITKIKNLNVLKKIKYEYVINLCGEVEHNNKKIVFKTHFIGLKNLLNKINLDKLKLFVQIGSSAEYGKLSGSLKESLQTNPNSHYGLAKKKATKYALNFAKIKSIPLCVLRPFQVYGPLQESNRIIPFVIKNSLLNKKFACSSGSQIRDFIYINDAISVIINCLDNPEKVKNKILNLGSGKGFRVKHVIKLIIKNIKKGNPIFGIKKMRKDEPIKLIANNYELRNIFKYKYKFTLDKGLKLTIKYFKKNEI